MSFPIKHGTVFGKKLGMSQDISDWVTPNWNYGGVTRGLKLGHIWEFGSNFGGVNVANELVQTKWAQIGGTDSSYSDYNFAVGGETKFTCMIQFRMGLFNYNATTDQGYNATSMGARMMLIDHFDDHNDSGVPADGWGVYIKPKTAGATQAYNSVYVNIMGTEMRVASYILQNGGNYHVPQVLVFSYDSSLGSENIKAKFLPMQLCYLPYAFADSTASETEQVSVTGNPIIGRAKQAVTHGTNSITGIVNNTDGTCTVTFSAQHLCLRRGTQFTITAGTTNFGKSGSTQTHTVLDEGLGMLTCNIATPGGDPATETSLTATWTYETYEPITGRVDGLVIQDLAFWNGVALDDAGIDNTMQTIYSATNNGPNWNNIDVGTATNDLLYSWHCMGDGLEDGIFTSDQNKIYNMSAVKGWQRNIVDRDIQTTWQDNSLYDPAIMEES